MQPGAWFARGFLVAGTALAQVLADDAERLARLGVTAEQVGGRLAALLESGAESDWLSPAVRGAYRIELHRRRGFITCPWAPEEFEPCAVGLGARPTANEYLIEHTPSRRRLEGFELSAHLVRDHGFFGGPGSAFRLEPEAMASLLGLGGTNPTGW
jgi:hypothetical protein